MSMPGRKYEAQSGYRYGFNGKEKDKDLISLTAYDYGFRIYNPGIGKFLSVDPLTNNYSWYTPYQFAGNTPIQAVDLDGLEEKPTTLEQYLKSIQSKPVLVSSSATRVSQKPLQVNSTSTKCITLGDPKKTGQQITAKQNGRNPLEQNRSNIYFNNRQAEAIETIFEVGKLSDINDAVVLGTAITRGPDKSIYIDGTEAGTTGVQFAAGGLFIPFVSGVILKEGSALIRGSIKVFKNGIEVLEDAVKIGKYGFKGTKAFNEIVRAVQAGGNIVASTKDEALKFLKEAFPDIADETNKTTSKFGFRVDPFEETEKKGLKQGHQGLHINYYDKENKIKGTILIDQPN
jgi:RHS repeat-associated protein